MTVVAAEGLAGAGSDVFAAGGEGSATEGFASRNSASARGAKARRGTVLGTPPGPGRESQGSSRSSGGSQRSSGGKRSTSGSFGSLAGKTNGGPLLAEYLGGTLIIVLGTFTQGGSKGYGTVMSQLLLRMTALTTVFFVLFLMSGTKGGKAAVWFGLLIDLGILFTAATEGATAQIADVLTGVPLGGDVLTASSDSTEPPPPVTLPSDQPSVTSPVTA
jgi:hypothetical protein